MRKLVLFVLFAIFTLPGFAAAGTFNNVPVVDVMCSKKVAANPDAHPTSCVLQCQKSGFGILTQDQKFLKFDAKGDSKVLEAIKSTQRKDHLRVDVTGDLQGDTLKVNSIKLR